MKKCKLIVLPVIFEYAKLFRVERTLKPIMETIVSG
jgi:hypothetical protein